MSDTLKKKYKVLLPTNGFEVGSVVELTEAEAANLNAGEPTPRLEEVQESQPPAGEPTPPTGGDEGASGGESEGAGDQNA